MFPNGKDSWLADRKGDGTKLPLRKHIYLNRDALTGDPVIEDERKPPTLRPRRWTNTAPRYAGIVP